MFQDASTLELILINIILFRMSIRISKKNPAYIGISKQMQEGI